MRVVNATHSDAKTNYVVSMGDKKYLYKIDPFILTTNNINKAFQTTSLDAIWATFESVKAMGYDAKIGTINFYQTELQ